MLGGYIYFFCRANDLVRQELAGCAILALPASTTSRYLPKRARLVALLQEGLLVAPHRRLFRSSCHNRLQQQKGTNKDVQEIKPKTYTLLQYIDCTNYKMRKVII